jgi:suppressor of G2 allele of SKP1
MTDALLARANELFVEEDYAGALDVYTQILGSSSTAQAQRVSAFNARSSIYIKLKEFSKALQDATQAIQLDATSALSFHRCGTALFFLDRFQDAKQAFIDAQQRGNKQCELMIRKCDAEIAHATESAAKTAAIAAAKPVVPLATTVKEQWYQSKTETSITLLAKNCPKDGVVVEWNSELPSVVSIKLALPDQSVYDKTWKLFAPISEIKYDLTPYKLEVTMTKSVQEDWAGLEEDARRKFEGVTKRENVIVEDRKATVYPSSSRKHADFNELEQMAKKIEEEDKPQGDQALQKLFQSIYKDADEDTRRAMIKSYQTSGGTVLSTNWKEVKDTDYEKTKSPPKGCEFQDWKRT